MAELAAVYAKQYSANVYMVAQQKVSKLRDKVTIEDMKGEVKFLDRVQPTTVQRRTSKYGDSPMIETKFDRRAIHASEYDWGDMIDWGDDLNIFFDPTSNVTKAGASGMGRVIDDIIIEEGFHGPAYEGKNGTTEVLFPDKQVIPITVGGSTSASNTGMNIEKLRQARSLFGKADIDLDDPDNKLYMAISQDQLDDLLRTTEITNADYNTVKALVAGTINSFMGFEFVNIQRLKRAAADEGKYIRTCVGWCKGGVRLALPQDLSMTVQTRIDKGNNWYAYAKLKGGATRIQDECVVQIPCLEG